MCENTAECKRSLTCINAQGGLLGSIGLHKGLSCARRLRMRSSEAMCDSVFRLQATALCIIRVPVVIAVRPLSCSVSFSGTNSTAIAVILIIL